MVDYAKWYLDLVRDNYRVIMVETFSISWCNKLQQHSCSCCFCISVANGHIEWLFSHLKVVKSNRRSTLGEEILDYLLRIKVDAPSLLSGIHLQQLTFGGRIRHEWKVNHKDTRASPSQKTTDQGPDSGSSCSYTFCLEGWEAWLADSEIESESKTMTFSQHPVRVSLP